MSWPSCSRLKRPFHPAGSSPRYCRSLATTTSPSKILSDERLARALAPDRLNRIRNTLAGNLTTGPIRYLAPLGRMHEIPVNSVDLIVSQAVMEHVDQLDLRCHDTAPEWNGHWKYADLTWRFMRGGRPWFINRKPCSTHIGLANHAGFSVHAEIKQTAGSGFSRRQLADRFKELSESDLATRRCSCPGE